MKQTYTLLSILLLLLISLPTLYGQGKCSLTQSDFQQYFASKTDLDPIEGIWTTQERLLVTIYTNGQLLRDDKENNILAIYRNGNYFEVCYFSQSEKASTFGTMFKYVIEKKVAVHTFLSI